MNNVYGLEVVNVRLVKEPCLISEKKVVNTEIASELIKNHMESFDREAFCVLSIATDGTPINMNVASIGTLDAALIVPREIFKSSILSNAAAIICYHCHPSGSVRPSEDDTLTTERLKKAGELLGIKMIDHIIVGCGTGRTYSFAENGLM